MFQRQSRTTTGNLTHLTSNPTEVHPTSDVQLLTQDGGRCGDIKVLMLSMIKERCCMFKVTLTQKTEILKFKTETMD